VGTDTPEGGSLPRLGLRLGIQDDLGDLLYHSSTMTYLHPQNDFHESVNQPLNAAICLLLSDETLNIC